MIKNYLKIIYRNFIRNKAFSLINIFGLAIGLVTCLLIMLYIMDESRYDRHHKDLDRLYRIASVDNKGETWGAMSGPVAASLKQELPEADQVTRLMTFPYIEKMLVKSKAEGQRKEFFENNGYYADPTFFQLFTYRFTAGNAMTALQQPNSIVISQKMANKFFGNTSALGRSLAVTTPYGEFDYTVKAVFDETAARSHIPANYFLSMQNQDMWNWVQQQTSWVMNAVFFTYLKVRPGTDPAAFEKKLNAFHERHAGADMRAAGFSKTLFIQPVRDIYLHSSIGNELAPNGNITYLYILGSIAAFILLIACINFMNLSTARSEHRAKEVGVRKVMGAEKSSLIAQFLGESFSMCLLALIVALLLFSMMLPLFSTLTGKELHPSDEPVLLWWTGGLTLFTGLLAGLYPALYLSSFKPVAVLKGKVLHHFSATAIRKGLVVFQFTISICLVLGAIVIWQQFRLIDHKDLGFYRDQQIILPLKLTSHNDEKGYTTLKNDLLQQPTVKAVTVGSGYPGNADYNDMLFFAEGKKASEPVDVQFCTVEHDYIRNLGLTLLNGRTFSKGFAADSASIILNETAVRDLGFTTQNAVGKKVQYDLQGKHSTMLIIGVLKDFNFASLHHAIKPFGLTTGFMGNSYAYMVVTVNTRNYAGTLAAMGSAWAKLNPETPFIYSFLDQDFQRSYEKDLRISRIVIYFTVIAILIACLGLFGLAVFSAERRTREIGIRKVLGASVTNVVTLLSGDFIRLVLIASLIAAPLAWYAMNRWLQHFAYKVTISWWMFVAASGVAVMIALATVSSQAIRAALSNPAKSLRSE